MVSKARVDIVGEDKTAAAWASALKTAQGAMKKMKGMVAAAGVGVAVGFIGGIAKEILDYGEEISNATKKATIGTKAFTELAFAFKQTGGSAQGLSDAFRFMQVNTSKAADGAKEQLDTFRALGLDIRKFKDLAPEKQFETLADRISKLTDEEDKARAATSLFGRSGANLLPMFEDGAKGIRAAREEAQKMGQSFTAEQIKKLDDAGDSIDRMKASFHSFAVTLMSTVSPALTKFFDTLSGARDPIDIAKDQIASLESGIHDVAKTSAGSIEAERKISKLRAFIQAEEGRRKRGSGEFTPRSHGKKEAAEEVPGFNAVAESEAAKKSAEAAEKEWAKFYEELDKENREVSEIITKDWQEASEEIGAFNGGWNQVFKKTMDEMSAYQRGTVEEMSVFWEQGMRNMQDTLADFLFDPFEKGLKGMLKGFIDVLRRMAAEAAAAKVFDMFKTAGSGKSKSGGFLNTAFNIGRSLLGFEHGGSFNVGGHGANDSQLVAFKASPTERVDITPAGRKSSDGGLTIKTNVVIHGNGVSKEEVFAAVRKGSEATIATLRDMRKRGQF